MNLKLLYITNQPEIAQIAQDAGVDRIFVDLETIGKNERQKGRDTVKSQHSFSDIVAVKAVLKKASLLVRINPAYEKTRAEVDNAIKSGADIIMLPMIQSIDDVKIFMDAVNDRVKTCLLIETAKSADLLEEIIKIAPNSEYFIGLNDLHLSYNQTFMFEPLADGKVDSLCDILSKNNISLYGFGGIARVGEGTLPAERIIAEHHRLGSGMVILSRTFCNVAKCRDIDEIQERMISGVNDIRNFEDTLKHYTKQDYEKNTLAVKKSVYEIKQAIENRGN